MKKLFASLMALVLMLSVAMAASVYTPVTPDSNTPAISHTMTLSEADMTKLDYEIEYTFTVTPGATVVQPTDVVNPSYAVTGNPSIANVTFGPSDTFDSNRNCTKNLVIDWSGVTIKEPGVYRWEVTKTVTDTDPDFEASNQNGTMYLYVYAKDNAGTLVVESVGLTTAIGLNGGAETKGDLADNYPAQTLDLSITKNVKGDQGSKDQYFKFTLTMTAPAGAASNTYTITGLDANVPETAYHGAKTNVTSITVTGGTSTSVDLWMKHGQTAKITNLVYGTSYTIVESENAGYTVTSAVTGDTAVTNGATVTDTSLQATSVVAYTNEKNATVPTGVLPMSSAPIAMMLAAAVMMLINKRKAAK